MRHAYEQALEHVARAASGDPADPSWRVTLHFHPDRLVDGVPILERMARDRVYRSQFETGVSNGGLTAYPGGDRWRWESRMFGAAYDDGPPASRPKYGSLNFRRRRVGASPRFGSAHLRLTAACLARATFCYPDSVFGPGHFGIAARVSSLVKLAEADEKDPLDDYIEAHVHGPIDITADVEALVLDPCYRATSVEDGASRLGCPVEWHGGFAVTADAFLANPAYRGPEVARLGASLARGASPARSGALTARLIGDASRAGRHEEQALKRVWHYVARFGNPEMDGPASPAALCLRATGPASLWSWGPRARSTGPGGARGYFGSGSGVEWRRLRHRQDAGLERGRHGPFEIIGLICLGILGRGTQS